MPNISLIVAVDRQGGIGYQNQLPWHLPADLAYFKQMTLNKPILMGRKTYESIGRPLPHRENIVLTHRPFIKAEIKTVETLEEALSYLNPKQELMVIGGASIYQLFMPLANRIYKTEIQGTFKVDTYFPKIDDTWMMVNHQFQAKDQKNPYDMDFQIYEKKQVSSNQPHEVIL